MRIRTRVAAFVVLIGSVRGAAAQSATVPTLSAAQLATVERGEPVQILEAVASPWPRSIVFQFIAAPPEQCAAVLADFERQSKYIPRMKSSRIVRRSAADVDVEYVIDVPVYPDERSISRQRVEYTLPGEYRVLWHTVVDSQAPGSVTTGMATFRPTQNSRTHVIGTLMIHDQTVVPASMFAKVPFVRNKAIEASRDAAREIAHQIERERAGDPDLLARQVAKMKEISRLVPPP